MLYFDCLRRTAWRKSPLVLAHLCQAIIIFLVRQVSDTGRRVNTSHSPRVGAGSLLLLAVASIAYGQVPQQDAKQLQREAQLEQLRGLELDYRMRANDRVPAGQRMMIDYGAVVTVNYLSVDDYLGDNHGLRQYDLIGYARVNLDNVHEIFARGSWSYQDFNAGDSFNGDGDQQVGPEVDRLYYRYSLGDALSAYRGERPQFDLTLKGGRDLVYWGNGLVFTQTIDGGFIDLGNDRAKVSFIGGMTPKDTVDFDSSRPHFDDDTHRFFYGAMAQLRVGDHRPYIYALGQTDNNDDDTLVMGPITTDFDYNSYYIGIGSVGSLTNRLRYGVEFAYEGGNTLSNSFELAQGGGLIPVPQTRDDIEAYAIDIKLDYFLEDYRQTRLSGEFLLGSADPDRGQSNTTFNGNAPDTKDRAFNAFGSTNTGLAFASSPANLMVWRVGASTFPMPDSGALRRLQVGVDVFVFSKLDSDAAIDEPTGDEAYLGWEPDVYVNWQITSDLTLAARYGVFFPNASNMVDDDPRQFLYLAATLAF